MNAQLLNPTSRRQLLRGQIAYFISASPVFDDPAENQLSNGLAPMATKGAEHFGIPTECAINCHKVGLDANPCQAFCLRVKKRSMKKIMLL